MSCRLSLDRRAVDSLLGLHVMLFSDNVALDDEIALKRYARDHGLLVMGPDCGTAIVGGYWWQTQRMSGAEARLDGSRLVVQIPMRFRRRGGRKRIVAPDGNEIVPTPEPQPDGR